ncbi:tetratricopeptide repeat protein [Myxococcus xanthus]|uniref:Sel1 repeat family protein n=1 Tax=Myxococcus xanthus TaxID=34 RepID=A0A7Y4MUP5_MYXXA|nr:tetratricopeptide repeat protein [Myxococcus xanthus]NOJ83396.1 sel1 repeat family protein [Myxococcus xanthus]NOJ90720.1 sel1 repeat family protein [Myxococcus xanthus]
MQTTPLNHAPFSNRKTFYLTHITPLTAQSTEYHDAINHIDSILRLSDRLLLSAAGTIDHADLPRRILTMLAPLDQSTGTATEALEALNHCLEAWLKLIICRISIETYEKQKGTPRFNLYQAIKDLDLLNTSELELSAEKAHEITDLVRKSILLAKEYRNPPTHGAPLIPPQHAHDSIRCTLLTMFAATLKHRSRINAALNGLITSPIDGTTHGSLLRMIRSERSRHLEGFCGRDGDSSEIIKRLTHTLKPTGGYLLVTAPEGFGKSALTARISELTHSQEQTLGISATSVTRECPWLPGALFHAGKQSKNPHDIVGSLIAQANALLLNPVEFEAIPLDPLPRAHRVNHPQKSTITHKTWTTATAAPAAEIDLAFDRSRTSSDEWLPLRIALHSALEKLVEERGSAILIIDSLDEISRDGTELGFLPQPLPAGATALLTSRDEKKLTDSVRRMFQPSELALPGLSLEEVMSLTKVDDYEWNRLLHKSSRGAPLYVRDAIRRVQERGNYSAVNPSEGHYAIFEGQVKHWRTPGFTEDSDPLFASLLLLSVFDSVSPLELTLAQSFLERSGLNLSLSALREILSPVSGQIEGLSEGRIKLAVKAFAEYVCQQIYGNRDLRKYITRVGEWLAEEPDADAKLRASFLAAWTDERQIKDAGQREAARTIIRKLKELKNYDALYNMHTKRPRSTGGNDDDFKECLRAAALGGNLRAARTLGINLGGKKSRSEIAEGEKWLRLAAEGNDLPAMIELGLFLIDSEDSGKPESQIEGEQWLRRAAEREDPYAMTILGEILIDGDKLKAAPAEGEVLIKAAAAKGKPYAMTSLAIRYIYGHGIQPSVEEGERLLRASADKGDVTSTIILSEFLFSGKKINKDPDEALRLLRHLAENGATRAMVTLAQRLFESDAPHKNTSEGEKWLRKAAEEEHPRAMFILGSRLIEGDGLRRAEKEGERWLRAAAERGAAPAQRSLGLRYLDGDGVKKSSYEGEKWLRRAIDSGEIESMTILGARLLDGRSIRRDLVEGEGLLRKAIASGSMSAAHVLGMRLLDGEFLEKDTTGGELLLRKAAAEGYLPAMTELGERIIDQRDVFAPIEEGIKLLEDATQAGSSEAVRALSVRLFEGTKLPQDDARAEKLLRDAITQGDDELAHVLGRCLYLRGISTQSQSDLDAASLVMLTAWQKNASTLGGTNLAYMIRRNEMPKSKPTPSIDTLLSTGLRNSEPFALVNEALRRAAGIQCKVDWKQADTLIQKIKKGRQLQEVIDWWHDRARAQKDPEGHLVLGLLTRHNHIQDPDKLDAHSRLTLAKQGGWDIPSWLFFPA